MPSWFFTGVTVIAILWLTLSPKPLGEKPPPLFPGADKIAHGLMFGGLVAVMLIDWQRKHGWHKVWWQRALAYAFISASFGIIIEIAQGAMGLGRSFEYSDILADTAGAFIFAILWLLTQTYWLSDKIDK